MNEHIKSANSITSEAAARHGRRNRRWVLAGAAIVAGALSFAGASYADEAAGHDGPGWGHHGMGMHDPMDPAKMAKHIDRMIARIAPDATAEQKTKLTTIARAAMTDLQPLRAKHRAAHAEAMKVLAQPTIDRDALEKIRANEQQLADQISRRMTQAMADGAEVLTPAQRAKAAERMHQRMEHMRQRKG